VHDLTFARFNNPARGHIAMAYPFKAFAISVPQLYAGKYNSPFISNSQKPQALNSRACGFYMPLFSEIFNILGAHDYAH
jgi:hypothetical protein